MSRSQREALGEQVVSYEDSDLAWRDTKSIIERKILERKARRILEVGAGANPLFSEEFLVAHGISYTALDISAEELAKAPPCYHKLVGDICADDLPVQHSFDFIFSRMLAEHVPDGRAFHRNVFRFLAPGGSAFHFFPTMWAPPFVLNRIMPEHLSAAVLHLLQRGRARSGKLAKFPAYYSWCRGPTAAQIRRLESIGYKLESYVGYFGHGGYYAKLPFILRLHKTFSHWLIQHPKPWFTSFAHVTLRKPA